MNVPQSALWFPMGEIKATTTTFYWTFNVLKSGTPSDSYIHIGISDLTKVAPGWEGKGLYFGGSLSDGSGQLIGEDEFYYLHLDKQLDIFP